MADISDKERGLEGARAVSQRKFPAAGERQAWPEIGPNDKVESQMIKLSPGEVHTIRGPARVMDDFRLITVLHEDKTSSAWLERVIGESQSIKPVPAASSANLSEQRCVDGKGTANKGLGESKKIPVIKPQKPVKKRQVGLGPPRQPSSAESRAKKREVSKEDYIKKYVDYLGKTKTPDSPQARHLFEDRNNITVVDSEKDMLDKMVIRVRPPDTIGGKIREEVRTVIGRAWYSILQGKDFVAELFVPEGYHMITGREFIEKYYSWEKEKIKQYESIPPKERKHTLNQLLGREEFEKEKKVIVRPSDKDAVDDQLGGGPSATTVKRS